MTKNNFILLLLLLTSSGIFAQIKFEKGYYISNDGQKTDCYIKNVGWINNPISFDYKLSPDGAIKTGKLATIKAFVIPNICKYEKHTVNVDMSTKDYAKLNYDKNPELQEKTIFLNVLVEGEASLYRYKDGDLSRFFYKKRATNVKPLVKKYYLSSDDKLAENNEYRQQLYTNLACESISRKRVANLSYNRNELTKFFIDYNTCKNDDFSTFEQKSKGEIHLRAELGISSMHTTLDTQSIFGAFADKNDTDKKWSPRFGVDLEYVLPFNRNKWAAFIAPYYQAFESDGVITTVIERPYSVKYAAIQAPLGIRHYMFLNDSSRIFINGGIIVDIPLEGKIEGFLGVLNDSFKTSVGGVIGIGYNYKDYFAEVRYITSRELLENTAMTSLDLSQFSFVLGYKIF